MAGFTTPAADAERFKAAQKPAEKTAPAAATTDEPSPVSAAPAGGGFVTPKADAELYAKTSPKSPPPAPVKLKTQDEVEYGLARSQVKNEWSGKDLTHPKYNSAESFAHEYSLGLSDESNALGDYANTLLKNAGIRSRGQKAPYSANAAWKASMDEQQDQREAYDKSHSIQVGPLSLVPAELAGGMLLPWGGAAGRLEKVLPAAAKGSQALKAILLGGAGGGISALTNARGDIIGDRGLAVPAGIGMGAATAGAFHGLNKVASTAGGPVFGAIGEALDRMRTSLGWEPGKPPTPQMREKANKDAHDVVREMATRMDPEGDKLKNNRMEKSGMDVTAAEALGREAETSLKAAGRRSGETADELEYRLRSRASETPADVVADFGKITGIDPEEVDGNFTAGTARMRKEAAPLYDAAYKKWGHKPEPDGAVEPKEPARTTRQNRAPAPRAPQPPSGLNSDALQTLLKRPSMKAALKKAVALAEEEGRDPQTIGIQRTQKPLVIDGKEIRNPATGGPFMVDEDVTVVKPSLQTWDYVKRALDDRLEDFRDSTTRRMKWNEESKGILGTKSALRDELYNLTKNPDGTPGLYEQAVAKGGEPLALEEAYKDSGRLMGTKTTNEELDKAYNKYTPAQREALRAGVINDAKNKAFAGRQRLSDMLTRAYEAKLVKMFGLAQAKQIIQHIEDRRFLLTHGQRMTPGIGSDTSETMLAAAEQDRAIGDVTRAIQHAYHGKPLSAALHFLTAPVMGTRRAAQIPYDRATRDAIGRLLMMRPSALAQALERSELSAPERNAFEKLIRAVRKDMASPGGVGQHFRYAVSSEAGGDTTKRVDGQ